MSIDGLKIKTRINDKAIIRTWDLIKISIRSKNPVSNASHRTHLVDAPEEDRLGGNVGTAISRKKINDIKNIVGLSVARNG